MSAPPSTAEADPDLAVQALQRGIEAAGAGNADDAIACFRQALALRPDLVAAQANLGLLLIATGRQAQAEAPLAAALDRVPANPVLRNALGLAQESARRWPEAERSYRAALAVRADFPEAHANLGNCLISQGRIDEAQRHLERAIELRPDFAAAHFVLGNLHKERGQDAEAAAHYRRALALDGGHVESLNNLGGCLRRLGAVDEARAAFERVLALRPDQIEAHCNLAQLKTYAADDPQIDRLLALEHRLPSLPDHGRIRYWFTAGKMLEDAGRHDESFAAYARGNGLKREQTRWDEATRLAVHRRTIATFTPAMVARAAPAGPVEGEGPVPVFIVGMPRSGTSLLEQVLATLPGVHGAGEIHDLGEVLSAASVAREGGGLRFPETLADCSGAQFRRLGRLYRERIRRLAPHASHVVDKMPANFAHVGAIHLMFPDARIVHAMRDPMDSCFSCYSRLFHGDNLAFAYDLETVGRYWRSYDDLMRHWRAVLPPGRMLDMPYEAMTADFEHQARRLVDYLGLPWDDRCLGFHGNRRVVNTASVAQVRRPIYRTSVARWKPFERHLAPLHAIVQDRR